MKKSEFRKLIREEIKSILNEGMTPELKSIQKLVMSKLPDFEFQKIFTNKAGTGIKFASIPGMQRSQFKGTNLYSNPTDAELKNWADKIQAIVGSNYEVTVTTKTSGQSTYGFSNGIWVVKK